jgi:hypothetical protein
MIRLLDKLLSLFDPSKKWKGDGANKSMYLLVNKGRIR